MNMSHGAEYSVSPLLGATAADDDEPVSPIEGTVTGNQGFWTLPTQETKLCSDCKSFPWLELFQSLEEGYMDRSITVCFKPSLLALIESRECRFCASVLEDMRSPEMQTAGLPVDVYLESAGSGNYDLRGLFNSGKKLGPLNLHFSCNLGSSLKLSLHDIYAYPGSRLTKHIAHRRLPRDPTSESSITFIRNCLSECQRKHRNCGSSKRPILPTRILDLGQPFATNRMAAPLDQLPPSQIRLIEPPKQTEVPFIALSHCWGRGQAFTTTTETLAMRRKSILVSAMPRTFQDAVTVTRSLGLRYLWIDSLCIIQNSAADWEKEAAQMDAVYANATVVLAATRSTADTNGFLWPRVLRQFIPFDVDFGTGTETLYLIDKVPERPPTDEPLKSRGWIVQERYLAERLLEYADDGIQWSCRQITAYEDGIRNPCSGQHVSNIIQGMKQTMPEDYQSILIKGTGIETLGWFAIRRWQDLVAHYTCCELTKETDMLPALMGLTKAVASATNLEFCAGIPRKYIIAGMLWRRVGGKQLSLPSYQRAPSWSWASLNGSRQFENPASESHLEAGSYVPLASCLSHTIESSGATHVKVALRVSGPLFDVEGFFGYYTAPDFRKNQWRNMFDTFAMVNISGVRFYIPTVFDLPDDLDDSSNPLKILFLAQFALQPNDYLSPESPYYGLVVRQEASHGAYERVGMVGGWLFHPTAPFSEKSLLADFSRSKGLRNYRHISPVVIRIPEVRDYFQKFHVGFPDLSAVNIRTIILR